jgi:hypothetical protein
MGLKSDKERRKIDNHTCIILYVKEWAILAHFLEGDQWRFLPFLGLPQRWIQLILQPYVYLDNAPDKYLIADERLIVSSDAWVLNGCHKWFNLISYIINQSLDLSRASNIIQDRERKF